MSIGLLYLLLVVLPSSACWIGFLTFGAGTGCVVSLIIAAANAPAYREEDKKTISSMKALAKKFMIVMIILGSLDVLLPDSKQIYSLAGAYAVSNDKELAKLPDNVLKAANSYLEKFNQEKPKQP